MSLNINTAIRIWTLDEGYRKINSYLIGSKSKKDYIYHQQNNLTIEYDGEIYNIPDIINIIKENMSPRNSEETYYRGASSISLKSEIKKSFISVTSDKEQAESFVDDCCLFKVIVDSNVKRYDTGVESETLLENNLYWNYIGKENDLYLVKVSTNKPNEINNKGLTHQEITNLLNSFKEECDELEIKPEPEDFVNYVYNISKNNISYETAEKILHENNLLGGKKIKKRKTKKEKQKKTNKKSKKMRRYKK